MRKGIGKFRPSPSRLPSTISSSHSSSSSSSSSFSAGENAKVQTALDGMLKQFTSLAEKHKAKAAEMPAPPKEDIAFKASISKEDVFKGVDMEKTKEQLGNVLKSLRDASMVATDLTFQFSGAGNTGAPQEEQMDYWFRRQQYTHWNRQLIQDQKIQLSRRTPSSGEKNGCWAIVNPSLRLLVGTAVCGCKDSGRLVKRLVYAKYDPDTLSITTDPPVLMTPTSPEALVYPLAVFATGSGYFYTIINVVQKEAPGMQVAILRSRIFEPDKGDDKQYRRLEGLFEKGLQAVDFLQADFGYLLVRGVAADGSPGHGLAILDLNTGLPQQWLSFSPTVTPYMELHGFADGLDNITGILRTFSTDQPAPSKTAIQVKFDRKSQQLHVTKNPSSSSSEKGDCCKRRHVTGSKGTIDLGFCDLPHYQKTGRNPPQVLLLPHQRRLVFPSSFAIQKALQISNNQVLLLGAYSDTTANDYLLARITLT